MIEGLAKAKRAYFTHYNKIVDYELIKELHESDKKWDISFMCNHLNLSRSAYYKWLNSTHTGKQLEDERILIKIKEVAASNKPNERWCTDVTEIKIPTTGEKLYISPVLDLYDRYPVSFAVSDRNDIALANTALEMAHDVILRLCHFITVIEASSIQEQYLKQSLRGME